jgi:hypothetical protein
MVCDFKSFVKLKNFREVAAYPGAFRRRGVNSPVLDRLCYAMGSRYAMGCVGIALCYGLRWDRWDRDMSVYCIIICRHNKIKIDV